MHLVGEIHVARESGWQPNRQCADWHDVQSLRTIIHPLLVHTIHSNMPHRIFEIDEILRIIAWHTKEISESAAISFACCCKAFEEPVLRPLWVHKPLQVLAKLLTFTSTYTFEDASFAPPKTSGNDPDDTHLGYGRSL